MITDKFDSLLEEISSDALDGPTVTLPVWLERGTRNSAQLMKMPLQQYVTVALCLQNLVVLSTDDKASDLS